MRAFAVTDTSDPDFTWVVDPNCEVVSPEVYRACSFPRCRGVARMRMRRSRGVYHYCRAHLWGRRVTRRMVLFRVHKDSPAAKDGHL